MVVWRLLTRRATWVSPYVSMVAPAMWRPAGRDGPATAIATVIASLTAIETALRMKTKLATSRRQQPSATDCSPSQALGGDFDVSDKAGQRAFRRPSETSAPQWCRRFWMLH